MDKDIKKLLLHDGIPACVGAIVISAAILNFGQPAYSAEREQRAYDKMTRKCNVSNNMHLCIEEQSNEQAHADPRYQDYVKQIKACVKKMDDTRASNPAEYKKHLDAYITACDKAAAIEDSILFANIKYNKKYNRAVRQYKKSRARFEKIQSQRLNQKQK